MLNLYSLIFQCQCLLLLLAWTYWLRHTTIFYKQTNTLAQTKLCGDPHYPTYVGPSKNLNHLVAELGPPCIFTWKVLKVNEEYFLNGSHGGVWGIHLRLAINKSEIDRVTLLVTHPLCDNFLVNIVIWINPSFNWHNCLTVQVISKIIREPFVDVDIS